MSGGSAPGQANQVTDISSNLTLAMDRLPAMQDRKKKIDMHVKLASKMLTEIKSRSIDKLQDIEDEILTSRKVSGENKQDLINILGLEIPNSDSTRSPFMDKVRLLLIMILCFKDLDQLAKYIETVENIHKLPFETDAMSKVKIMFNKKQNIIKQNQKNEEKDNQSSQAYGFARTLTKGLASGLSTLLTDQNNQQHVFARELKQSITQVRNKYPSQTTKYMDMLQGETVKLLNANESLQQVFVFSIGGGSFHEYESFKTIIEQVDAEPHEKDRNLNNVKVIYGCDYMFQPTEFLDEILKLN